MTSDRRRLLILGGVAVVLLLAGLVLPRVLLGGGDGGSDDELATPPSTEAPADGGTAAAGASPTAPGAEGPVDDVTGTEIFSTKNPFAPLVDTGDSAAAGEATDTTGSSSGGADGSTDGSSDDETPTTTAPAGSSSGGDGSSGAGSGSTRSAGSISLVDVYPGADGEPVANVEVDDALYTVAAGESFASRYTVVSLSADAGTGTFSDPSGQFTLTEGEAQLK